MKKGIFAFQLSVGALIVGLSIYGYSLLGQRPGFAQDIKKESIVEIEKTKISQQLNVE